jgi:hypothetical protein
MLSPFGAPLVRRSLAFESDRCSARGGLYLVVTPRGIYACPHHQVAWDIKRDDPSFSLSEMFLLNGGTVGPLTADNKPGPPPGGESSICCADPRHFRASCDVCMCSWS